MVTDTPIWFLGTAVFLFFGAGFYALNLVEIDRKQKNAGITFDPRFVSWQWRRLLELLFLSGLSFAGRFILIAQPANASISAIFALLAAIWQLVVNHDYRKTSSSKLA